MKKIKRCYQIAAVLAFGVMVPACTVPAYTYPQTALIKNFARAIIAEDAITTTETDITVSSVLGFPIISSTNEYFYLVLVRATDGYKEIVKVTEVDTANKVLTVVRHQDNTNPQAFSRNDRVELWVTAGLLEDYRAEQRGLVEAYDAEKDAQILEDRAVSSNINKRLSGVVTTGRLDIAAFDAAAFTIISGKVSVAAGGLKTAYLADELITAHKLKPGEDFAGHMTFPAATTSASGMVVLASSGDITAGTNTTRVITPEQLKTKAEEQGKAHIMKYSGVVVYSNAAPTSYTNLSLTSIVGTNRALVNMYVYKATGSTRNVFFKSSSGTVLTAAASGNSCAQVENTTGVNLSVHTGADGNCWWMAAAGDTFTVTVLSYQILQ